MTPFIDVMLVLLIIFMVAAPLLTAGVPLDLPQTRAAPLNVDTKPVTLSIRASGQVFLGETELTDEEIVGRLASTAKQGFDERIKSHAGMEILVSESADFNEVKGYEATLRLMKEFPSANVIYSHNDAMSFGVITALEELGKVPGSDVLIVSIDGTKEATQDIIDGKIACVVECNPKFGPIAFDTMLAYARGEKVPLRVDNVDRVFDSSNAADYLPEAY